jgi:Family of unknown function (DUF6166)
VKRYTGERTPFGAVVMVHDTERPAGWLRLALFLEVRAHSPDGFEWGYGGSGPAQLALALACDVLGDVQRALRVYQRLKWRLIAGIEADVWTITDEELLRVIYACELENAGGDGNARKQGYHQGT